MGVWSRAPAVIAAWQRWAPQGPDELSADLVLSASDDPASEPSVDMYGAVGGSERDASELLAELTARIGSEPVFEDRRELSYGETCLSQAELSVAYDQIEQTPHGKVLRQGYRYTKSEFFSRPLPGEAIAALINSFTARRVGGQIRTVGFAPWGGAYNGRSPQDTAF